MNVKLSAVLLLAVSTYAWAMEKSSSSAALEGAPAEALTNYVIEKNEVTNSTLPDRVNMLEQVSAAGSMVQPAPQVVSTQTESQENRMGAPTWQTSLKASAAGFVGAGVGEVAYRLGLVSNEKTCIGVGAAIGMGAFGGSSQLKNYIAVVKNFLSQQKVATQPEEIELIEVPQ